MASDGSLMPVIGHRGWAGVSDGEVYMGKPAESDAACHSDVLELQPIVVILRDKLASGKWKPGSLVVITCDSIATMYRINKGSAAYGTPAARLLRELYDLADDYDVDFFALWLPRAANQVSDALSKCSDVAQAGAWAQAQGLRLVRVD